MPVGTCRSELDGKAISDRLGLRMRARIRRPAVADRFSANASVVQLMATYSNTYVLVLARTIDIMLCGWIWRDYGVTISSMTGLELRKPNPKLWARILGWTLNHLQANHCEMAIVSDTERANQALAILKPQIP